MMPRTPPTLDPATAVPLLRRGGVLAYPTEAVWGLGCDPRDRGAVLRLLEIKQRPVDKGLILVAASLDQLKPWVDFSALAGARLAETLASWPGPHTWILPTDPTVPAWVRGAHDGIAVRVSAHPVVVALCEGFGGALVSTSANLSGAPAPRTRDALDPGLLAMIDGVLEGRTGGLENPTRIRDARSGDILRD
jgi:L-threonylcarbamoyladenylate synthase